MARSTVLSASAPTCSPRCARRPTTCSASECLGGPATTKTSQRPPRLSTSPYRPNHGCYGEAAVPFHGPCHPLMPPNRYAPPHLSMMSMSAHMHDFPHDHSPVGGVCLLPLSCALLRACVPLLANVSDFCVVRYGPPTLLETIVPLFFRKIGAFHLSAGSADRGPSEGARRRRGEREAVGARDPRCRCAGGVRHKCK